jgi:hypothetical protein
MEFAKLNLQAPFTVEVEGKKRRFDPRVWEKIGTGWNYGEDGYWEVHGILFNQKTCFFLVERLCHPDTDDVFSFPTGVSLSPEQAAEWCVMHDVAVPSALEEFAEGYAVIPESRVSSNEHHQPASNGGRPEDGLYDENRRLVWGGVQFTLTTNQAMVFELLVDAYPSDVLLSRFEDIGIGALRDSFRRKNTKGKKEFEPVWYLIDRGSRKDSKRMLDPAKVKTDSRFISAYPT